MVGSFLQMVNAEYYYKVSSFFMDGTEYHYKVRYLGHTSGVPILGTHSLLGQALTEVEVARDKSAEGIPPAPELRIGL